MKTSCPECGARNPLWRVATWWSGVHVRCRECRHTYRLIETPGALFGVTLSFGLVYVAAFWALCQVTPPAGLPVWLGATLLAAIPAAPAAAAAVLVTGWLHRLGAPDRVPRMSGWMFATVYGIATLATTVMVGVVVAGILMVRFGEPLPEPDFEAATAAVAIPAEQVQDFAFVDLVGTRRSLAELRGSVVFVHLFDPDVRGTRQVLESVRRLRKETQGDGVLFAVVGECTRARLTWFVDRGAPGLPYATLEPELPDAIRTFGDVRPLTFVVGRDGRVVFSHRGLGRWDTDAAEAFLRALPPGNG